MFGLQTATSKTKELTFKKKQWGTNFSSERNLYVVATCFESESVPRRSSMCVLSPHTTVSPFGCFIR